MLLGQGLRALQIALLVAGAYLVYAGVAPLVRAEPIPEVRLPEPPPVERAEKGLEQYASIARRNLFKSRAGPLVAAPVQESVRESKLAIQLIGTVAGVEHEESVAIVVDPKTHEHKALRVGEEVTPGVRLTGIERRRILIENRGEVESVTMDPNAPPALDPVASRIQTERSQRHQRVMANRRREQATNEKFYQKMRRLHAQVAQTGQVPPPEATPEPLVEEQPPAPPSAAPPSLLSLARFTPVYGEGGAQKSLEVRGISAGSLLDGKLQEGDQVVSVNGTNVEGADLQQILPMLSETFVSFGVKRGEEIVIVNVQR